MFRGSITALVTPFKNGNIDWKAFDDIVERQIENGASGVVPCGTTGESPTLSHEEHRKVVERCVKAVKGRIPVIAGTGSNSTAEAIEMTAFAKKAGADAVLIVTPYYNKPTQEGLYAHYHTIAGAVEIPIIIYNIPGRSIVDMSADTMGRLARIPHIIGVKDATADMGRVKKQAAACGEKFCQLSGEDATIIDFMEQGGVGCISVTSNIAPRLCADLHEAWNRGDREGARKIHKSLIPLHKALFCETSPQPVKYAASRLGLCADELRLPLVRASIDARKAVDEAMEGLGLVSGGKDATRRAHG